MVGPVARDAMPHDASRSAVATSRALAALAALAVAFGSAAPEADGAWRLALGTLGLAAAALAIALPWSLACLVYLAWYAPPALARAARPSLRLLASLPSLSLGLGVAALWPPARGGVVAPAALGLGAFVVPRLVLRGDRLLRQAAPLRAAALAVGARPLAAFALVVWPAVRPAWARALAEAAALLVGEAALVVPLVRASGRAPPTLAAALAERQAPAAFALLAALSLALGALAERPGRGRDAR
jgi:ABC-type phosphate transport system permease subunit